MCGHILIASLLFVTVTTTTLNADQKGSVSSATHNAKYYSSETDLLLTLRDIFKTHLSRGGDFTGERLNALKTVISLFAKHFPLHPNAKTQLQRETSQKHGIWQSVKNFFHHESVPIKSKERLMYPSLRTARELLRHLNSWLNSNEVTNKGSITQAELSKKLDEIKKELGDPFPDNTKWDHCKVNADLYYRGFPCGLWNVFHGITVDAYLIAGVGNSGTKAFDPVSVIKAVAAFVQYFFQCATCRDHFAEMTNQDLNLNDWVKRPEDVILWLWRAHNMVNQRLAEDPMSKEMDDPDYPKVQFPSEELCPSCWRNGQFYEPEVKMFLLRYYTEIKPRESH